MTNFNHQLFFLINQKIANPWLDFLVLKIFIPLFLLLGFVPLTMLFFKKYRELGFFSLISGIFNQLIGEGLKILFHFPRPFDVLPTRTLIHWDVDPFSFPSSTTMLAFGLVLPFFLEKSKFKLRYFLLILVFLVGFTVIYTGFHFPSDVLAGIFFSIFIVFLLKNFMKLLKKYGIIEKDKKNYLKRENKISFLVTSGRISKSLPTPS